MFRKGNQFAKGNKPNKTSFKKGDNLGKTYKEIYGGKKGLIEKRKRSHSRLDLKGKHRSKRIKEKISISTKGEKNHNWKGGISKQKKHHCFMVKQRQIKKVGNGGSHTLKEWENLKAQYNWTCPNCGLREPFKNQKCRILTEDHIIPISKGGSNNIENIQPLCKSCNSKKHTEIIKY